MAERRITGPVNDAGRHMVSGHVVQVVNVTDGAVATGTTVMVDDDGIPVKTEGDEYMTLAITPKNTSNLLRIDVLAHFANTNTAKVIGALFQDATTNALAAVSQRTITDNLIWQVQLTHWMTAGTEVATTFRWRMGDSAAGTTTFNGVSGGRKLGGVMASSITITEIAV